MDLKNILVDTKHIAKEAGVYIFKSMNHIKNFEYKDNNFANIVTDVDKKSEEIITNYLKSKYSEFSILSEEGTNHLGDDLYKWIIDPIDGTTNFVHGFPFFAVSIGLEYKGEIVLGVVYDPCHDEMFSSIVGEGSFLNEKKIEVSKNDSLEKSLLGTGFANDFFNNEKIINLFVKLLKKSGSIRRTGSAALHLCFVACGRLDGYWEAGLSPWDTAAGVLIVKEAGGKISNFASDNFSHYDREILATNGLIHEEIKSEL